VYLRGLNEVTEQIDYVLVTAAVLAAFAGGFVGKRVLTSMTMTGVRRIVAAMLFAVAAGLVIGILR
jgi:uncharacterized membrane protein YfcA